MTQSLWLRTPSGIEYMPNNACMRSLAVFLAVFATTGAHADDAPFFAGKTINLEIGYMTPPLGLNLFLSSRRFDKRLPDLYRATMPFWAVLIVALALVTYLPRLSLWLPDVLRIL